MIHVTHEMLKSGRPVCQGEVIVWLAEFAPASVKNAVAVMKGAMVDIDGPFILGHSETGHHHVIERERPSEPTTSAAARALIDEANAMFVELELLESHVLKHERSTDTHEAICLPAGRYIKATRQEQTVEGWRAVSD